MTQYQIDRRCGRQFEGCFDNTIGRAYSKRQSLK